MAFLGEETADQKDATPFSPRCNKDLVEESLFFHRRHLFSELDIVFFDTTSIYFEGRGGKTIGQRGFSKDHRPDLKQMVVGAVINDKGCPICCEMWSGNTTDVKTLIPVINRLQARFPIKKVCIVANRGMISSETIDILESPDNPIPYILGTRMRRVKAIRDKVLSRAGRYEEVRPEGVSSNDPASLKVKEVMVDDTHQTRPEGIAASKNRRKGSAFLYPNPKPGQMWQDISSRWCGDAAGNNCNLNSVKICCGSAKNYLAICNYLFLNKYRKSTVKNQLRIFQMMAVATYATMYYFRFYTNGFAKRFPMC